MNDLQVIRQALREDIKLVRSRMTDEEVKESSRRIALRVLELEPVRRARTIMGFACISNEVDLWSLLDLLKDQGKTVLLPRVSKARNIEAVEYTSSQKLQKGIYGILEPEGAAFPPGDIDAVLVPGLVYDARGYRLGYGAGCYDRFLPGLRKDAFICGVCYEYQVVDDIHPCELDVPVHWIVTDRSELVINWDFF